MHPNEKQGGKQGNMLAERIDKGALAAADAEAPCKLLIADDQPHILEALRLLLKPEGYQLEMVRMPALVLEALAHESFDGLLIDLNYTRDTTSGQEGLDLVTRVKEMDAQLPVVDGFAVLASGRRRWPRLGSTLADNCVPTTPERNSTTRECTSPQGRTAADGRRWVGASCRPGGSGPVTCTRLSRASARGGGFTTAAGSCR